MRSKDKAKDTFSKILNVVNDIPLQGLLETAEGIVPLIPAAGTPLLYVIKALKLLLIARPVANSLLSAGVSDETASDNSTTQRVPVDVPASESDSYPMMTNEEMRAARERAEIMTMLDQMIDIAAEDGELSDEELSYLIDIAKEIDFNEKAVIAKVKMKCAQNRK